MVEAHLNGVRNAMAAGWETCSNAAAPRSMRRKKLWSSWKTTRLLMPVVAASLIAKAKCNSTPSSWMARRCAPGASVASSGCVNPVRAARKFERQPACVLCAEGAERFAAEHGIALCSNEDLIIPREVERLREFQARAATQKSIVCAQISHDTSVPWRSIANGNIAAATSTGGTLNKAPGRLATHR